MGRQLHELFLASCGVFGQWGVRLFRTESIVEEHRFHSAYTFVGNHDIANLSLDDPQVSRRHAYLQVLPGGLFCVDLDSRAGIRWADETRDSGWLLPCQRLGIGPYALELLPTPPGGWLAPANWPHGDPLADRLGEAVSLTPFVIEVVEEGKVLAQGKMNRVMALVGRSPRCLFHIKSQTLSKFHCSLVRTPMGLWLFDLQSRGGTFLNGRRVSCGRLQARDEVQVGRFTLRFRHPDDHAVVPRQVVAGLVAAREAEGRPPTVVLRPASEENRAVAALPNDPGRALELSQPAELRVAAVNRPAVQTMLAGLDERGGAEWSMLVGLVSQFNLMQQQMFDQFQESMLMTSRMFASLHQDQMALVREELEQLRGIAGELRALQEAVMGQRAHANPPPVAGTSGRNGAGVNNGGTEPVPPARGLPAPEGKAGVAPAVPGAAGQRLQPGGVSASGPCPSETPEDVHAWLNQRISALQGERETRWHKLLGLILGK